MQNKETQADAYLNKEYQVLVNHLDLQAGEIVEEFLGNTYGCVREDEIGLKTPCIAVNKIGDTSFRIIPEKYLIEIG